MTIPPEGEEFDELISPNRRWGEDRRGFVYNRCFIRSQRAGFNGAGFTGFIDEEAGEIPKAFVVLRSEITAAELAEFINARVAPHKKIRQWEFVETIPKPASGKILRRLLRH